MAGAMTATTAQMDGSDLGGADISGAVKEEYTPLNGIEAFVNQEEPNSGIDNDQKGIKGPLDKNMGSQPSIEGNYSTTTHGAITEDKALPTQERGFPEPLETRTSIGSDPRENFSDLTQVQEPVVVNSAGEGHLMNGVPFNMSPTMPQSETITAVNTTTIPHDMPELIVGDMPEWSEAECTMENSDGEFFHLGSNADVVANKSEPIDIALRMPMLPSND